MKRAGEQPQEAEARDRRPDRDEDGGDADTNAQLRAMRAVWLSMREEDPPDGGLVDLLAAARAKAATMRARPTLGQRVLAALRRPPALAFASVVVLVGGAVLLAGRRGPRPEPSILLATPSTPVEQADAPDHAVTRSTSAGSGVAGMPTLGPSGPSELADTGAARGSAPERQAGKRGAQDTANDTEAADGEAPGTRTGEPRSPAPVMEAKLAGQDGLRTLSPPRRSLGAQKSAPPSAAGAASTAPGGEREKPIVRRPTIARDRLYRQCEAAAERGDCAAVRRLVVRITSQDRSYRARIAKDSAVGRCLASDD